MYMKHKFEVLICLLLAGWTPNASYTRFTIQLDPKEKHIHSLNLKTSGHFPWCFFLIRFDKVWWALKKKIY